MKKSTHGNAVNHYDNRKLKASALKLVSDGYTPIQAAKILGRPVAEVVSVVGGNAAVEEWEETEKPLAKEGTFTRPGSIERMEVYAGRYERGEDLFHPMDCNYDPMPQEAPPKYYMGLMSRIEQQIVNTTTWSRR